MKRILITLFSFLFSNISYADEIAITFDDLPSQENESADKQQIINHDILSALQEHKATAVVFVNESKLYEKGQTREKISILQSWINQGHLLGNHSYSHPSLNNTTLEDFKKDVIKGSNISKILMQDAGLKYNYFRHPFLHTGTDPEKRSNFEEFLKKQHYIIAPVTIDTDDGKFNKQLLEHPENQEEIIKQYLQHTREKFLFYKEASQKIFNRNVKHIWLLHINLINAYAMNELLNIVQEELKYEIIPLHQALRDKAYTQTDNYYAPFGASWLYRWDFSKAKLVDWSKDPQPDKNPFINTTEVNLFDQKRNRSVPLIIYVNSESQNKAKSGIYKLPVVILNHGYGVTNKDYRFLAENLAGQGYCVISIQHDLKNDSPLPRTGNLFKRRTPIWERGLQSILLSLDELKKTSPYLNLDKVILIGHSNGGDMSMLFATNYPEKVSKIISLDSLRYPFPTKNNIPILSLRANDTKADTGVLPISSNYIHIVNMNAKHIDMYDAGPMNIKQEILNQISKFLK